MSKNSIGNDVVYNIRKDAASRKAAILAIARDTVIHGKISSYIKKNNGDQTDADTIFNDTIVTFVKMVITKKDFQISTHPHAMLMGIAKNHWMNALRKKNRHQNSPLEVAYSAQDSTDNFGLLLKDERGKVLRAVLGVMAKKCKEVLMHWASGYSMVEIADLVGYKSEGMARKKKSECMKQLYTYLADNPHIKERIRPA